jgi:hypothetical protein
MERIVKEEEEEEEDRRDETNFPPLQVKDEIR